MNDDVELLRRYVEGNSEEAFTELVRQHLGLVHHAALRYLGDDAHGAQDVVQRVFTDLARKAPELLDHPLLASWLHTSTRYAALRYRRDQRRRASHEQAAAGDLQLMNQPSASSLDWEQLRLVIDEALQTLKPAEREAVLLRFFEGRDYVDIGARLQLSQHGVRARVERALDKMQARLARRGIVSTSAVLGGVLSAHAAEIAPAGAAPGVARIALDAAAAGGAGGVAAGLSTLALMKASALLLAASLAANAGLAVLLLQPPAAAAVTGFSPRAVAALPARAATAAATTTPVLTDPEAIGRRLRELGYPDQVVTGAVNMAVMMQDKLARRDEIAAREARARRWNPAPRDSIAVLPAEGLRVSPASPLEGVLEDPAIAAQKEKALAGLGLDSSGQALESLYRGIPAEKARLIRKIESDYTAMWLAGWTLQTSGAMYLLNSEFERDVLAVLTPGEQTSWLRYSSNAAKNLQRELAGQDISEQSYFVLADAAVKAERTSWATGSYSAELQGGLYRTYRQELGDERFLVAARNLSVGAEFAAIDVIYVQAGVPAATRVDRYLTMHTFYATNHPMAADRTAEATQVRGVLTSGLNGEQMAAFEATKVGQALRSMIKTSAAPAAR